MATTDPIPDIAPLSTPSGGRLLITVAAMPAEQLKSVLTCLTAFITPEDLLIATPNEFATSAYPALQIIPTLATNAAWPLTAADFANAYSLGQKNGVRAILMLGPESSSLNAEGFHKLANTVLSESADLVVPLYDLPPHAGLVNSAILYPLTRGLFATRVRFPMAIDLGLSLRMAERLAVAAKRFTTVNQSEVLLWPVNEALVAGFTVDECEVGSRILPQPADSDVNAILSLVTGSLFADIEAKAAFWQRPRRLSPSHLPLRDLPLVDGTADVVHMIDAFQLAYTNLQEIWSLVLPPNSMLSIKRLSVVDASAFRMPENLWARIVFDFLIAYRLRTINRGHLLGALIPLYLAWVASHINIIVAGTNAESHIEEVAAAFETEKPYLVSRWRWPDRFNS